LIDGIRVEGQVEWKVEEREDHREGLTIRFYKPSAPFVLHLGDLPAITFKRMEPLSYTFSSNSQPEVPHVFLLAREYATRLLIPEQESSVILVFSEEMNKDFPVTYDNKPVEAEWLDNKHLQIQLKNMDIGEDGNKEISLRLDTLKAESGNYLEVGSNGLMIRKIPEYEWHEVRSGQRRGFSPRDRFYDQMVLANDKQSYVGIVKLGGSMGDGDGTSYSFVLERKGHDPIVIEHVFYSTIQPGDMPVQWMDDKTIMYSSYYGVYTYDIEKGEKQTLHISQSDESNNINFATYDSTKKIVHLLAYINRNDSSQLDLFTYKRGDISPDIIKHYTDSGMVGKYSELDMNITPTSNGTYWSRIQEGIPVTDFVNKSGIKVSTQGIVRVLSDKGAYMERFKKGDFQLEPVDWVYWQPNKQAKTIAKPPEDSQVFVCGIDLFVHQDSSYYKYDLALNKWLTWKAANNAKDAQPLKGSNGMYRTIHVASLSHAKGEVQFESSLYP
jgi:hypothetical protein